MSGGPSRPKRSRLRRWGARLFKPVLVLSVFVSSFLGAFVLHSNVAVTRQGAADIGTWLLADVFYGKLTFGAPTRLSLDRLELPRVRVLDELGKEIIELQDVRIELGFWGNLGRFLSAEDKLTLAISHARIERAHVNITVDERTGEATLVRALTPKPRPKKEPGKDGPSREVRVFFPILELGQVTATTDALKDLAPTLTNVQSQLLVTGKGVALDVHRLGANVKGLLGSELSGTGTLKLRAPGETQAQFVGFLGEVEVQVAATLQGKQLELEAYSRSAKPNAMRALLGAWPFEEAMSAKLTAKGELPQLATTAKLSTENSSVEVVGDITLAPKVRGQFEVTLNGIDARTFSAQAPSTTLNGSARIFFEQTDNPNAPIRAEVVGRTEPFVVEENEVPGLSFNLTYENGILLGELDAHEPNMPFNADVTVQPGKEVRAKVSIPRFSLEKSRRVPNGPKGTVTMDADVHFAEDQLELHAHGRAEHFRFEAFSADRVDFDVASVSTIAELSKLPFEGTLSANNARYGRVSYGKVSADVSGNRQRVHVAARLSDEDGRDLKVKGDVFDSGQIRNVSLEAKRHGVVITAQIDHADPSVPAIEVSRVTVQDQGATLEGKVRYQPGLLEGELTASNVDLARLADAFGLPSTALKGTLDSDSSFALGKDLSRASLHLGLKNAAVENWGRMNVLFDATLRERSVTGSLSGSDETTGILIGSNFDVELAGHSLEPDSYTHATGNAEVSINNVNLAGLDLLLDDNRLADLEGLVGLRARLQRDEGVGWPSALIELGAQDVAAKVRLGDQVRTLRSIGSYTSAMFNAKEKQVFGSGMIADPSGPLLTLTGAVQFDPDAFLRDPQAAVLAFQDQPINIVVTVPQRSFDSFPLVQPEDVPLGAFGGQLTFYGTPGKPQVSTILDLTNVAPREGRTKPVSFKVAAQYAPDHGDLDAKLQGTVEGRNVAIGTIKGVVPLTALMGVARWNAEAKIALDRLPLDLVPQLRDAQINGTATGTFELSQKRNASLVAHLDVEELRAGRAVLGNGTLRARGGPGEALMSFVLADKQRSLTLRVLALGDDPEQLPLPHRVKSVGISLLSTGMNAGALSPVLGDAVARLHGDLDADLTWFVERTTERDVVVWQSRLEGDAKLSNGSAYVGALGLELHDVDAVLTARPAGNRTLIQLKHLTGKARTREVNFEADGQLYLEGTEVVAGDAEVLLRTVPITLQGLSLGNASGRASLLLERMPEWDVEGPHEGKPYLLINVALDHWNMKAARKAGRQLIDIKANPDIIVLQRKAKEEARPDLTPYRVIIRLEEDVRFGFGDISLPLEGEAIVDYDGESRINGELRMLPGSRLPIFGKRFDVLSGTIELDPKELGNPALDIALTGTTPEGNIVHLTVSGTLREPVMDPPPSELQALLGGGTATLLGGGVQALGVNELLGESVGAVELRVDAGAEEEDDPSYAAAVQIGPNLWFEGGYQRAQDSGLNQNQTDVFSGSVDYRFHRNWSLKTRLGNAGGGVDVLWQHRY